MDERTHRRMQWGCRCGHVARSAIAEARHRHNFPALCRRARVRRPRGEKAPVPSRYDPGTKSCYCGRTVYSAQRVCPRCDHVFYPSRRRT